MNGYSIPVLGKFSTRFTVLAYPICYPPIEWLLCPLCKADPTLPFLLLIYVAPPNYNLDVCLAAVNGASFVPSAETIAAPPLLP